MKLLWNLCYTFAAYHVNTKRQVLGYSKNQDSKCGDPPSTWFSELTAFVKNFLIIWNTQVAVVKTPRLDVDCAVPPPGTKKKGESFLQRLWFIMACFTVSILEKGECSIQLSIWQFFCFLWVVCCPTKNKKRQARMVFVSCPKYGV